MVRAVLVGRSESSWELYRQPQWMAEVRRDPSASELPRRHFDLEETAFARALEIWGREAAGSSLDSALATLNELGAVEVGPGFAS
jgi:hypothetical protein